MNQQVPSIIHPIWSSDPWVRLQQHFNQVKPDRIIVICDTNTYRDCYDLFCGYVDVSFPFEVIVISAGEPNKNIDSATRVWSELSKIGATQNSLIINLGGGMVCDLGAFCASTFHRGVPFINIPTSALAMVDASLGGKNGIDLGNLKNIVGTINFPTSVIIEINFLKTLPEVELQSGYAEMLKQIIIADKEIWNEIRNQVGGSWKNMDWWKSNVQAALAIKMNIVSNDPFENGIRKRLNFGHTVGHGIESFFLRNNQPIPHGFAVAAGMLIESYISNNIGILSQKELEDIEYVISRDFDKLDIREEDIEHIILFMKSDKKNVENKFSFSMVYSIGDIRENYLIEDPIEVRKAFEKYIHTMVSGNE